MKAYALEQSSGRTVFYTEGEVSYDYYPKETH